MESPRRGRVESKKEEGRAAWPGEDEGGTDEYWDVLSRAVLGGGLSVSLRTP